MTDYTGTEAGCKGRMLTGCRDGTHGWGCPLADPVADVSRAAASAGTHSGGGAIDVSAKPEYVCEHEGCDRPAYRPKVRGQLLCAIHSVKIEIGGRRSGKTHRMNVTKGIFILADLDKTAVDTQWRDTKGPCWVCPVCATTDTWWQVQLLDSLSMPPRVDQEALVRNAAIEHMAEESATHDEWILDYLEMTGGEW